MYFDLYSGDICEEHFDTMEMYDTNDRDNLQLVCSRVIGRKISQLPTGSEPLKDRVKNIMI